MQADSDAKYQLMGKPRQMLRYQTYNRVTYASGNCRVSGTGLSAGWQQLMLYASHLCYAYSV